MELFANLFGNGVKWTWKSMLMLGFLAVFPNLLGLISVPTGLGFNFHVFQILIFTAALIYGPFGGAVSGLFGSLYSAAVLNNPYIIFGNILLGFFFGVFAKKTNPVFAVLGAFAIQLPWLWVTDIYFAHMPTAAVQLVVVSLLASNILWAFLAVKSYKKVKALI
ncbi:MAG: hypothetical protein V1494_01290 [Candidatus Diapherotrites archaeon]